MENKASKQLVQDFAELVISHHTQHSNDLTVIALGLLPLVRSLTFWENNATMELVKVKPTALFGSLIQMVSPSFLSKSKYTES